MQQQLLTVNDLTISFDLESVVSGVSFNLYRGETVGIVGESGSGKSVTALSILGLLDHNSTAKVNGAINYYNHEDQEINLRGLPPAKLQQIRGNAISMIFQEPKSALNPVMSCGVQIVESLICHRYLDYIVAKNVVLSLFKKVNISDPERVFEAYPHELSGGLKQRVLICMAICCGPDLLIADEPTTALDMSIQKSILDLLQQIKKEHAMSMLFISHDLRVIGEIADRVLVMYKGEIVEQGTTIEILTNPQHPYTKALIACQPPLDVQLRKLPVISDFIGKSNDETASIPLKTEIELYKVSSDFIRERRQNILNSRHLLEVVDLSCSYPVRNSFWGAGSEYVTVVDAVSFDLRVGETIGLVGESGCGKTTLSRALLKLIPGVKGTIRFEEKDIENLSGDLLKGYRKDVQIIFQDPFSSLNPRMKVAEAVLEPMRVHNIFTTENERRQKVDYLMDIVGLEPALLNRYPHELSGGQRQRTAIARALSVEPKLLICDECVSALDVSVQAQVLNLLVDLREKFQLSCIFISHDLSVVKFMSERILVMNKGKIVESGFAEDIYNHPKNQYTKMLVDSLPGRKKR